MNITGSTLMTMSDTMCMCGMCMHMMCCAHFSMLSPEQNQTYVYV